MSSFPREFGPRRPPLSPKLLLAALWAAAAAAALASPRRGAADATVPAAFAFGDSVVDPGNNNGLATVAKCNFPPYGRDLDPGVPIGRFSNGRVPSDMLGTRASLLSLCLSRSFLLLLLLRTMVGMWEDQTRPDQTRLAVNRPHLHEHSIHESRCPIICHFGVSSSHLHLLSLCIKKRDIDRSSHEIKCTH